MVSLCLLTFLIGQHTNLDCLLHISYPFAAHHVYTQHSFNTPRRAMCAYAYRSRRRIRTDLRYYRGIRNNAASTVQISRQSPVVSDKRQCRHILPSRRVCNSTAQPQAPWCGIITARDADIGAEHRQVDGQKMEKQAGSDVYRGAFRASILRLC